MDEGEGPRHRWRQAQDKSEHDHVDMMDVGVRYTRRRARTRCERRRGPKRSRLGEGCWTSGGAGGRQFGGTLDRASRRLRLGVCFFLPSLD